MSRNLHEFVVAGWSVRPQRNIITKGQTVARLSPLVMDLLVYLAERPGEVVSNDRLARDVWQRAYVGESAVLTAISALRKAFGDDYRQPTIIETIPKRGYRLVAESSAPGAGLAVLPMKNLSGRSEEDFFADGVTDLLIAQLGRTPSLRVISCQSIMRYRSCDKALSEIASELNASMIVEGSVLKLADRVRITVQLIDAATDSHLWADSYEHALGDVLAGQSEIAIAIASAVTDRVHLVRSQEPKTIEHTVHADALIAYLRGLHHFSKLAPAHIERALEYYEESLRIDPEFAPAYSGIANAWGAFAYWGLMPAFEVRGNLQAALDKGSSIDPSSAEIEALLGAFTRYFNHDGLAAEAHFRRAIQLNPNLALAHLQFALYLSTANRPEAPDEIDLSIRLDPVNPGPMLVRILWLSQQHRYQEAQEEITRLLDIDPRFIPALQIKAELLWYVHAPNAMRAEREAWFHDTQMQNLFGDVDSIAEPKHALEKAADFLVQRAASRYVQPRQIARLLALAGRFEASLDCLERAANRDDLLQLDLLQASPAFRPLRDQPRFRTLIENLGLPV